MEHVGHILAQLAFPEKFGQWVLPFYALAAPGIAVICGFVFAAAFTFNAKLDSYRTNIYEQKDGYARTAKMLASIAPGIDPVRPLRLLITISNLLRFCSLPIAACAFFLPRNSEPVAIVILSIAVLHMVLVFVWLTSMWLHHRHEVEQTAERLRRHRDEVTIDSGLGTV